MVKGTKKRRAERKREEGKGKRWKREGKRKGRVIKGGSERKKKVEKEKSNGEG